MRTTSGEPETTVKEAELAPAPVAMFGTLVMVSPWRSRLKSKKALRAASLTLGYSFMSPAMVDERSEV